MKCGKRTIRKKEEIINKTRSSKHFNFDGNKFCETDNSNYNKKLEF